LSPALTKHCDYFDSHIRSVTLESNLFPSPASLFAIEAVQANNSQH